MNYRFLSLMAVFAIWVTSLALAIPAASEASDTGARKFKHAELYAGTSTGQKKAGGSTRGLLVFDSEKKMLEFETEKGDEVVSIPYSQVKSLLYEEASKPRYTEAVLISPMFLLAHSKKHYLTIQYTDANGAPQYAILQLDKKNAQEAVAAAQAETGKTVERAEEK
jgi:protein involved in temperature-dependent protein secretion